MKTILPSDEVDSKFDKPIGYEVFGFNEINRIVELKPEAMHAMGLSIWNRIVHYKRHPVDPMALAKDIQKTNPKIHMRVANLIRRRVVNDICYMHGKIADESLSYKTVAEMLVAHVYDNEIHLSDIEFSNPYLPIPDSERKFEHQHFSGLGLLPIFMDNLERYAREKGCQYITLTAAARDHLALFSRYGFEVEKSLAGRMGEKYGLGIPMEKEIM